jgi:ribonuclease HI
MAKCKIYTDGGCRGNPGIGAWAMAVYLNGKYMGQKSAHTQLTTNNQMELQALLEALKWLTNQSITEKVTVYSDSAYAVNGFNNWLNNWERRGWRTASHTEVKNVDQWKKISKLKSLLENKVSVEHVKAHAGIEGNEKADWLCNQAMNKLTNGD